MKYAEFVKLDNRNLTEEAQKIAETLDITAGDFEEIFQDINADDYDTISATLVEVFGEE